MTTKLSPLDSAPRLLFAIPLIPLQGQRFQPTGFPGLGAATFRSPAGDCLLVESAQSMANRLETTIWDEAKNDVIDAVKGISHVTVSRPDGSFLTDTILEAHRLNSPYLLAASNKEFLNRLKVELDVLEPGPVDRKKLAQVLLKFDVGSLLHGIFLEKIGGRLRLARALSAFVEADGVRVAASGGVKNDHVNPSGDTKSGFGNVPFARDEFSAERITLFVNLDLAQIRGYGLPGDVATMLTLLALYKLRLLIDGRLRFRTACDLKLANDGNVVATAPEGFVLPPCKDLADALQTAIHACAAQMVHEQATFGDKLEVKQQGDGGEASQDADGDETLG